MRPRSERAFTLLELLIVIAIIGILAGLLLPTLIHAKRAAKNTAAAATLADLRTALAAYHADYGAYPVQPSGPSPGSQTLVRALRAKGPRRAAYRSFADDGVDAAGNALSPNGDVIHYVHPSGPTGPDGRARPDQDYLMWTRGYVGSGPEAAHEVNTWGG